ncbi:branched-chain amino acid transporter permease [Corynebacterium renale]|uniref:Branched-subunit amino acid transport protein AzlD n=1 Tax=Corynebacterium renale TaxID=1724 RepID=A0A2A9DMS5_9CORY|nr:AzlD domain-containing protein [Corynebacterium renale]PFG27666.1 branched-subunit amino acid transport protein AzlD [Corynebacterium renale]SQI22365.1 hypothetical membrane protein [Corynebacterium renale]
MSWLHTPGAFGLPEGTTLAHVAAVLIPIGIVTVLLRWAPFLFQRVLGRSTFVASLGATMPIGVMVALVIYTLFGLRGNPGGIAAGLIATAVTLGLHWWRGSLGLSIAGGTATYMVFVNVVFAG